MPTGYTAKLYEGEQTFEDFVLRCSRAFGALVLMRDSDPDAPVTIEAITDSSDYHVRELRRAKAELARLNALTTDQVAAEARSSYLDRKEEDERYINSRHEIRKRYEDMREKVRAWEPPSQEHTEFKQYMIDQLTGSIDFDTSLKHHTSPAEQTPEKWLASRIERAESDIAYHTEEEAKRIERNEGRLRWVNQLRESLGLEALIPA